MEKWHSFPVLVGFLFSFVLIPSLLSPTGTYTLERDSKWDSVYSKGSQLYLIHCAACRRRTHVASGA